MNSSEKPKVSFTFDDGKCEAMLGYDTWEQWDEKIRQHLRKRNLRAAFFAAGTYLDNGKGRQILKKWRGENHLIGNHTYSHNNYNCTDFEFFKNDFLRNDDFLQRSAGRDQFFRFPYLKEGETASKRDAFRSFLQDRGTRNGKVTIDASDWYINDRLVDKMRENGPVNAEAYANVYVKHILERAVFYETLATQLTGRRIAHVLLLHHNLLSALFLDELMTAFELQGWQLMDVGDAYQDEIYGREPDVLPAGESLIWAMAKESGRYDHLLRYPAEHGEYEKQKLDELGL